MIKKISAATLSLSLVSGLAWNSTAAAPVQEDSQNVKDYSIQLADYVSASPELQKLAKTKGFDLAKKDPAEQLPENGTKFQQAGDSHVAYQNTDDEIPMLVLLAKFKDGDEPRGDAPGQVPAKYFDDLIFGDTYNPYQLDQFKQYDGKSVPKDRTMQNAYSESSYGKVELTTYDDMTDIGWVELPRGASYYLDQTGEYADGGTYKLGNANGDAHTGELVRDLLKAADDKIDFSKYAVNGQVPNIFIVHEGTGAEFSGDPAQIWSHKWSLLSALYYGPYYDNGTPAAAEEGLSMEEWIAKTQNEDMTYDGVMVNNYTIEPEIGGNVAGYNDADGTYNEELVTGPYPAQVGVFAHEFGHALGLPDFYDTTYTSEGVGNFSLMAGGSWTSYPNENAYSGNSPVHFDPFSKQFLGWADPVEVTPGQGKQTITLPAIDKADADNGIVKMAVPGSNGTEYFLFENVQQSGFNKGIGNLGNNAEGLVAWHVDENIISLYQDAGFRPNNVANFKNKRFQYNESAIASDGTLVTHYGLSVVQADGQYDLEKYVNRGDEGDFFNEGENLTPQGNVHSGSYYFWQENNPVPASSGIHVTNIQENKDGSITADFYYDFGAAGE